MLRGTKIFDLSHNSTKVFWLLTFLWVSLAAVLVAIRVILTPFIIAILLVYVLSPVVSKMQKITIKNNRLPKFISVLVIYLSLFGTVTLFGILFLPELFKELVKLSKEISFIINKLDQMTVAEITDKINIFILSLGLPLTISTTKQEMHGHLFNIDIETLYLNTINSMLLYLKSEMKNIIFIAKSFVSSTINTFFQSILILMICAFLLVDLEKISSFFHSLVPKNSSKKFNDFLAILDKRLSGVVRGQITICLVNAFLTLLGLLIFKIKFAFTLALIAGIFSLIPIFGSIISTVPIVLVAVTTSYESAIIIFIWIVGIHFLEANLLNPKIMGDYAKIHPALIILALVTGKHFYGLLGAILAVPITSIILTVFSSILNFAKQIDNTELANDS